MRAMILSAGYGTRLWPLTEDRTKPAIPILGKPLVGYVAEYLADYDCTDIIVNLHHRPESVRAALGDGKQFGVRLQYVEEPQILGTSGALDNARHLLGAQTFVVINGKIITNIDLGAALDTHRATKALATLVLLPNFKRERFSVVNTRDGLVTGFGGMPANDSSDTPMMFTGIQIMEPEIFDYIPKGVFSHSTVDVYPRAIAEGRRIAAHVGAGNWYELSTIPRYLEISLALLAEKGESNSVGRQCVIANNARLSRTILWDNVIVEPGARLKRVILADNVRIPAGEEIEDAAVVSAALVQGKPAPEKALKGVVRGSNFVVPIPR
ncbi:MAG TPA: NDP-sugar synthase [Pyrinomonadaceae bacterium]|nr:NDP-sugar synthase [Pyrinomonadaceae bacterium]